MRLYITLFILAVSSGFLFGQGREAFRISNLKVSLTPNDSVEVHFSIIPVSEDATRKGELVITPTIFSNNKSVCLQSLYLTKQYDGVDKLLKRKAHVPDSLILLSHGVLTHYSAILSFREWMNGANIKLEFKREQNSAERFLPMTLQHNLALRKAKVVPPEEPKKVWKFNEEVEFILLTKGLNSDIIKAITDADYTTAIRKLSAMEGNAIVWNALGIAHGYKAEFEMAQKYFEKAAFSGLGIATININELNRKVTHITL